MTCDVVAELYTPTSADAEHPVPAMLTTNGWGQDLANNAPLAQYFAGQGYAVLNYSGLGWGGSSCKVQVDRPEYDGKAASQLIDFLAGAPGIGFTDAGHSQPATPPDYVIADSTGTDGQRHQRDIRVGMVGVSYGGGAQFAAASVHARIDAIAPIATWNNLVYSLFPNGADQTTGVASSTPGVSKLILGVALAILGVKSGLDHAAVDPLRLLGCPNMPTQVCAALTADTVTGVPSQDTRDLLASASVANFADRIKAPTLLLQGQADALFDLNESSATFAALRAAGTPVQLAWVSGGHTGAAKPGDYDLTALDARGQYAVGRLVDHFAKYLKKQTVDTGPDFVYQRPWVTYTGNAVVSYASAEAPEAIPTQQRYLSGGTALSGGRLVDTPEQATGGLQTFLTGPAAIPTSLGSPLPGNDSSDPDLNLPGTYGAWTSQPLTAPVDVVGSPSLTVQFQSPTVPVNALAGPTGMLTGYAKLYDIGPDGVARVVDNKVTPFRVADIGRPTTINLTGTVYRFAAGHRLQILLAGGDLKFRGGLLPNNVTVFSKTGKPGGELTLPVTS
nr:CocE/NonD family hydrolase [Nakamurella aerolata]